MFSLKNIHYYFLVSKHPPSKFKMDTTVLKVLKTYLLIILLKI